MSLTLGSARPMPPALLGRLFFWGGGVVVVLLWQTPPFPARRCSHSAQSATLPATPRYTGQNVIFCKITHDNDRLSQGGVEGSAVNDDFQL